MGILRVYGIFDEDSDDVSYDVIWRNMEKIVFLDFLGMYVGKVGDSGIIGMEIEWGF